MKNVSKILALLMALCVVLSLGVTAFASAEPSGDPSAEPSGEASDEAVWDAYVEYLHDYLVNVELPVNTGGMTLEIIENEFMPLIREGNLEEPPAVLLFNGLLDSGVAMTYEEFAAQYQPAGAQSVEDAFIDYIHEWLIAEDEINDNMDENIRENEFMPLVREMNFVDFPAEMIYSGMLEQGVPMTFEEFAAQYTPAAAAPAGGDTSEEAYHAYLKEYVDAVPAVDDEAFQVFSALIDASDYTTMPADMMFDPQWWGYSAMTYDEFVAAGGVYEIPAFDPNLRPD